MMSGRIFCLVLVLFSLIALQDEVKGNDSFLSRTLMEFILIYFIFNEKDIQCI